MKKSQTKIPLSVFIITKNEEDRVGKAIKSIIDWVDEVIIIDSGSTDKTVEVCKKLGAKVIFNEWNGYGPQKVFGESLCNNDWVLNIDADEEASTELRDEIINLFGGKKEFSGYNIQIPLFIRRHKSEIKAYTNSPVRLYHKQKGGFSESTVHDSVIIREGEAGKLNHIIIHRSFRSYQHSVEKMNYYSTLQAKDMFSRKKKISKLRIIFEPILAFFKAYFLRRYFLLGIDGVIESYMYAFSRMLRLAKTHELFQQE